MFMVIGLIQYIFSGNNNQLFTLLLIFSFPATIISSFTALQITNEIKIKEQQYPMIETVEYLPSIVFGAYLSSIDLITDIALIGDWFFAQNFGWAVFFLLILLVSHGNCFVCLYICL